MLKLKMLCLFVLLTQGLFSQQGMPDKLPVDPKVRIGKLPNGMTYYIRHNELPKERADFYIVQNVGSMQEEDNQRGLAHFLEHMAFNGSKNFPKETRSIDDFTESIGMRMGENLNAYTSFDETVYMLSNVPVNVQSNIDSCLLVLHDWSAFLTLADSMIDKERGVIREEWRTRSDAQMRLWEQQLPKMYPGSRYANRLPIGSIDVINNFKYDELRAYYKKWYRPDLQGIIIVGDIDVDKIEELIKTTFSDIPAPVNPAPRELATVPDNKEPLISIAKDKESPNTILSIYYKHNVLPDEAKGTMIDYLSNFMRQIISHVMSERFTEMLQKADPPFIAAYAGDEEFMIARTKDAWVSAALVKPNGIDQAMNALVTETNRLKQFGITEAEYDRAKSNILMSMESLYKDRDNQKNNSFTEEYVRNFTTKETIPGIEMEYQLTQQLTSSLPVLYINQFIQNVIGKENIVISLMGPDKEGITFPTEAELLDKFVQAQSIVVEAAKEEVTGEPLIAALPQPGKITDVKENQLYGSTVYTLSNGIKVIVKETEFKKDEILMRASSKGGSTLFSDNDAYNMKIINQVIDLGGLSDFSATTLSKMLAGKNISCNAMIGDDFEGMTGSSTPKDMRTLFELIYLYFTAPRSDDEAYASFSDRMKGQLENLKLNPMIAFNDTIIKAIYDNQIRAKRLEAEDFQKISYARIIELYKNRFADASDFIFSFVGNIEKDSIIPLMEQYLATLPSLNRIEQGDANRLPVQRKGAYSSDFSRQMETPKASIINIYTGQLDYSVDMAIKSSMLKQILDLVYMEKVRENESGTYGVRTSVDMSVFPAGKTTLQIYFDTDPTLKDKLTAIIKDELMNIANNGPREEDFIKTRDNMLKSHEEALQENAYWLNALDTYNFRGYDRVTDYKSRLESITPAMIQDFLKQLINQGNLVEVSMASN
ncbi:MAG: insulinase family protein [Tannerella sp.]|nr:insulinase family protein [Tannerella sp.]